jgi:3-isopropylmalate/(R)-2-methylmalate dehydratase small subunit
MKPLSFHDGLVVVLSAANVDTDILVPRQYLKRIERTGLGDYLFDRWRYLDRGNASDDPYLDCSTRDPDPDFPLNQARHQGASILIAGANFGCGSSREQAVWALAEWGFRVLVAPSFGDIFFNNCHANGVLPIVLSVPDVDALTTRASEIGYRLQLNLPDQTLTDRRGGSWTFEIDQSRKASLIGGLDAIAYTLAREVEIATFEAEHRRRQPWL